MNLSIILHLSFINCSYVIHKLPIIHPKSIILLSSHPSFLSYLHSTPPSFLLSFISFFLAPFFVSSFLLILLTFLPHLLFYIHSSFLPSFLPLFLFFLFLLPYHPSFHNILSYTSFLHIFLNQSSHFKNEYKRIGYYLCHATFYPFHIQIGCSSHNPS